MLALEQNVNCFNLESQSSELNVGLRTDKFMQCHLQIDCEVSNELDEKCLLQYCFAHSIYFVQCHFGL